MKRSLVPLLAVSLLVLGCTTMKDQAMDRPCPGGGNEHAPIICIDDIDLSQPVRAIPKDASAMQNSAVIWKTLSGQGELLIVFRDAGAVQDLVCTPNSGQCTALAKPHVTMKEYDYVGVLNRGGKLYWIDPTLEIKP